MTGSYLLRVPGGSGGRTALLGASLTSGTPTHHLHTDFQFATPVGCAGFSLGAFRRFEVGPGDVVVVPPSTLHGESGGTGRDGWHLLHLPPGTVQRFAGRRVEFADRLIRDPGLAASLIVLVTAAIGPTIGSAEFLQASASWVERLTRCHGVALPQCGIESTEVGSARRSTPGPAWAPS